VSRAQLKELMDPPPAHGAVGPAAPANRNAPQPTRRSFASLVALGIQN
jgi:hypothetical protein